jgi:hypothetical protein
MSSYTQDAHQISDKDRQNIHFKEMDEMLPLRTFQVFITRTRRSPIHSQKSEIFLT